MLHNNVDDQETCMYFTVCSKLEKVVKKLVFIENTDNKITKIVRCIIQSKLLHLMVYVYCVTWYPAQQSWPAPLHIVVEHGSAHS